MRHTVAFYETDAMGIVHHSNQVRFLELARIAWLEEYDRPYQEYLKEGFHFAVTRVEVDYLAPLRFGDSVEIACWVDTVRYSSLRLSYLLTVEGNPAASAATELAALDDAGRVRRLPKERRLALRSLLGE